MKRMVVIVLCFLLLNSIGVMAFDGTVIQEGMAKDNKILSSVKSKLWDAVNDYGGKKNSDKNFKKNLDDIMSELLPLVNNMDRLNLLWSSLDEEVTYEKMYLLSKEKALQSRAMSLFRAGSSLDTSINSSDKIRYLNNAVIYLEFDSVYLLMYEDNR